MPSGAGQEVIMTKKEDGLFLLAVSADGEPVYMNGRTLAHMKAHSDVEMSLVGEAVGMSLLRGAEVIFGATDMGRVIGTSSCVPSQGLEVTYVTRPHRAGATPFVHAEPVPTSLLTWGAFRNEQREWILITAYYGAKAPREPWDPNISSEEEREASGAFWSTHALCFEA